MNSIYSLTSIAMLRQWMDWHKVKRRREGTEKEWEKRGGERREEKILNHLSV